MQSSRLAARACQRTRCAPVSVHVEDPDQLSDQYVTHGARKRVLDAIFATMMAGCGIPMLF